MDLKDIILNQSSIDFSKWGIRGVSMDKIAEEVGISKRTLYETFKSKDELVLLFIHDTYTKFLDKVEKELEIMGQQNCNEIEKLCFIAFATSKHKHAISPVFFEDLRKYYPDLNLQHLSALKQRSNKMFSNLYLSAQKNGYFRKEVNLNMLFDFTNDIIEDKLNYVSSARYTISEVTSNILYPLIRGMSTAKGRQAFITFLKQSEEPFFKSILNSLYI